jgi:hypothetical protein
LCDDELNAFVAWIKVSMDYYMEISYVPCNYQALHVGFIRSTPEKLRAHARKACKGWACDKWNIDEKPPTDKEGNIK